MNIGTTEQALMTELLTIYPNGEASSICNWVMEHFTGKSNIQRRMDKAAALTDQTVEAITIAKNQLLQHRPVQYVLGESWFMGFKYFVDENVLIPRPETEELVHLILASCQLPIAAKQLPAILDIGTGSGCIPVAIKKAMPGANITAIDISHNALQVAIKNAATHSADIRFLHLNFLDESRWQVLPLYDIIVSNPPYIPFAEKAALDKNVTDWEPGTALFVPDNDALLFYKKIAAFGKTHLRIGGKIFVETHQDYAVATQVMFIENGYNSELTKDINGNNRMLTAWRKSD